MCLLIGSGARELVVNDVRARKQLMNSSMEKDCGSRNRRLEPRLISVRGEVVLRRVQEEEKRSGDQS